MPNKIVFLFRVCLLNCVLTGLLFSCGEGIRLFPFPEPDISSGDQTNLEIDDRILYQFNAPRLEDKQERGYKTKSKRNSQHLYWLENYLADNSAIRVSAVWKKIDFYPSSENFNVPLFSRSGESRAPPFKV